MIETTINKLLNNHDIENSEINETFDEIFSGLADSILVSSFVTALKSSAKMNDFLVAGIKTAKDSINKINISNKNENLIENFALKDIEEFIDIPFAIDIICAANDLGALRYSFNSPFYKNRSFNTLGALGVKFEGANQKFIEEFEKLNFAYLYLEPEEKYYKYTNKITRKLPFFSIFNIIDKALNPYGAKNQLLGINNFNLVEEFANICLLLNNSNSIVLCSKNNLPFVSLSEETKIAEAWKNKIFSYTLTPELLGFKSYDLDEIKCENDSHNAEILFNVFNNKIQGAPKEIIIINAALALYIAKKTDSILEGLELAKKTIEKGLAMSKLEQLKNFN